LNHGSPAKRNASGSAPVRRLRAEADINLPTIPDESVENDPIAGIACAMNANIVEFFTARQAAT
jgi:hypothetical protein